MRLKKLVGSRVTAVVLPRGVRRPADHQPQHPQRLPSGHQPARDRARGGDQRSALWVRRLSSSA